MIQVNKQCMKQSMNVNEASSVCRDKVMWQAIFCAYLVKKQHNG